MKKDYKEIETETLSEINDTYKKLIRKIGKSGFAEYKKIDLHIHTPASHDYVYADEKNDETLEYKLLLEKFSSSDIDVIAITDHNNINGYERIIEILKDDEELAKKLSNKLILPGIEIDCYGSHFLTIFDNNIDIEKIKSFIYICGLNNNDKLEQSADRVTPVLLCEEVYKLNGIVILAHADTTKGFMQKYFKDKNGSNFDEELSIIGTTVQTVLKSKSLLAISINNENNIKIAEGLLHNWKINKCKIIQSSDSHSSLYSYEGSGKALGTRICWVKMSSLTYKALQMALKQENSKIKYEFPKLEKSVYMLGLAANGGFLVNANKSQNDFAIFPFSSELNCLIGARGTGKSTLIEIIKYIFSFETYFNEDISDEKNKGMFELPLTEKDLERHIINRYKKAIIYISCEDRIYAIYSNPIGFSKPNIKIYENDKDTFILKCKCNKINDKSVNSVIKLRENFKIKVYEQKELQEMTSNKNGVTTLIDGLNIISIGTKYLEYKMLLRKNYQELKTMCTEMFKERLKDKKADWSNDILVQKYDEYYKLYLEFIELYEGNINSINEKLKGKLELSYRIEFDKDLLYEMSKTIAIQYERMNGNNYSLEIKMQKDFQNFISNNINGCPNLLFLMFTHNHEKIYNTLSLGKYSVSKEAIEKVINMIWNAINQDYAVLLPQPIIDFKLNVNYEIKPQEHFVYRNKLSFGQRTVGALLLIMHGATEIGDKLPLIIDQPEDDLDNSYIYHMLVKQFCIVKERKQLLIATHNPNIPVCGEAENILVMESDGKNGWIECYGTVDNSSVAKSVLRILEGDFEAFKRRAEIYGFELINLPK